MKMKLSRLLCALLVFTTVFAMVPAVSADGGTGTIVTHDGSTPDKAIVMYVGDITEDRFGCTETGHTNTVKYYTWFNDKLSTGSTSSSYMSYNITTRKFTASNPTATTQSGKTEFGAVKVEVSCSYKGKDGTTCSKFTTQEKYYKIYSKATGFTLKDENGTTLSDPLTVNGSKKIYYTLSPATANQDLSNVTVASDDSSVATVTGPAKDEKGTYVTVTSVAPSATTVVTLTADAGTGHATVSKSIGIITGNANILTLKSGNTTIAKSSDKDATYGVSLEDGTFKVTAVASASSMGNVSNTRWSSSDSSVAVVSGYNAGTATFTLLGAGTTTITGTLGGVTASFELQVISNITAVKIRDYDTDDVLSVEEIGVNETLTMTAAVTPYKNQGSAAFAVWSTSNPDIVDFDESRNNMWTIDPDTGDATGETVRVIAKAAGRATISVKIGSKTYASVEIRVNKAATSYTIVEIPVSDLTATVRRGTKAEVVARMNANSMYKQIVGTYQDANGRKSNIYIPVEWVSAEINGDTAKVRGQAMTSDGERDFTYASGVSTTVTATVSLTDEAVVTNVEVTANKTVAVENDTIRLTANATVEPSNADVKYQWYANGKAITGATSRTTTYTIPKASVDSSTEYRFTCEVTASNKGTSSSAESKAVTVSVSRDYTVSITLDKTNSTYTIGDKPKATATLYYKGSAVSNTSFSWQLLDTGDNTLSSNIATISGSGNSATVTTKGTKYANGEKITIRASIAYKEYTYSSSVTITVNPAAAADIKQSVGSGAAIKASSITNAVTTVAGSSASVSYIVFDTPRSCTLYKSSSSTTTIGDTKCYVSTSSSSSQKLSDVYVKTSSTSASVGYTAYDADGYVLATGTVRFDSSDSTSDTITSSGATMKTSGAVDQITSEYANVSYVKFDLPKASDGKLYYNYTTIAKYDREVKDTDKFYIDASSSQDDVEKVYFVPVCGVKGTVSIGYTAYSSSNTDLGNGTIKLTVKQKTVSDKFTDITYNNTGYWAADSIDFMADNSLFNGASRYQFSPNTSMTRAMLVTVLYRAAGEPSVSGVTNPFKDIKNDYYYNAVLWAYKNNVVTGTSATTFSPDANVTREQIATILYRYMGSPTATGSLTGYSDRAQISSYATTAMQWAIGKGYITGTSSTTLDPLGQATRAQAAVMLHRFLTK